MRLLDGVLMMLRRAMQVVVWQSADWHTAQWLGPGRQFPKPLHAVRPSLPVLPHVVVPALLWSFVWRIDQQAN